MADLATAPIASSGAASEFIFGVQDGVLKRFIPASSKLPVQYKVAGVITAAEILGNGGTLITASPVSVMWTLLTDWQYGFSYPLTAPFAEEVFGMQRRGLGIVNLATANYRGRLADQAAMLALVGNAPGDWCSRTDLSNQRFVQTGATAGAIGNWTAVPMSTVNQPPANWGVVATQAAQVALVATLGDVVTRSDLTNQQFRLTLLPASDFANWSMIDSADFARIRINNANNIDIGTLPARHSPLVAQHTGCNMWDLY